MEKRNKNKFFFECYFRLKLKLSKNDRGFTLIELLVVVAIIGLLSSVVLIALVSARQKSRDARRIGDMTQMNTGLELYFASTKGYPSGINGSPQGLQPSFLSKLPIAPTPADGVCENLPAHNSDSCTAADPSCVNVPQNTYYYVASGTPYILAGLTLYPDYAYYFCLGNLTGNFLPGPKILTPRGVR